MIQGQPVVGGRSSDVIRARRSLLRIAGAAAVLAVALYAFAVGTRWGQRLDTAAQAGRHMFSTDEIRLAQRLHIAIDVASVALLGGLILLVAFAREGRRLATGVAVILLGSFASAEVLKRILGRPHFAIADSVNHAATFPSGHTAVAMALSVGAVLVVPRRARSAIAIAGAIFTSVIACSLVMTASHRVSDTIGAVLVVTVWSAGVAARLARSSAEPQMASPGSARLNAWMFMVGGGVLVAALVSAVVVAVLLRAGRLDTVELGRAFVGGASAVLGTTLLCTSALLVALHDVDLAHPGEPNST